MSEKVAKLDSIVGRFLSYITLCLHNICEKLHLLKKQQKKKKNTLISFLLVKRKIEPPGLCSISLNTPFLAQVPSLHGSFPVLCSSTNCDNRMILVTHPLLQGCGMEGVLSIGREAI